MNPGTGHRITAIAAAAGLNAAAASQGTTGLLIAGAVTVLGYVALVISVAIPEWVRLRALREPGRQLRWLVTHLPSTEAAEKLAALWSHTHIETVRSIEAIGASQKANPRKNRTPKL
ncbi:hypothetical protein ACIBQ1_52185 [Nonomuraea sp. NPDC050153]|uniref:hypothetical protein n=1 Tax=Nonomuraea sp. NPDC050153 TaxID=3364359 RepID=UPI0037B252DB